MFNEMLDADIEMGQISSKKIIAWAEGQERFKQVTSDEDMLQKAFEKVMIELEENRVYGYEEFTRELCDEVIKMSMAILFARTAVQLYFEGKTEQELNEKTLNNQDWLKETEKQAIRITIDAVMLTTTMEELKNIRLLAGIMYDDGDLDDSDDWFGETNIVQ